MSKNKTSTKTKQTLIRLEDLIAKGFSKNSCASELGISVRTLDRHLEAENRGWKEFRSWVLEELESASKSVINDKNQKKIDKIDVEFDNETFNEDDSQENVENILSGFNEINENLYTTMLLRAAQDSPTDIRIITEVRNYLDKTEKMRVEKADLQLNERDMGDLIIEAERIIPELRVLIRNENKEKERDTKKKDNNE